MYVAFTEKVYRYVSLPLSLRYIVTFFVAVSRNENGTGKDD